MIRGPRPLPGQWGHPCAPDLCTLPCMTCSTASSPQRCCRFRGLLVQKPAKPFLDQVQGAVAIRWSGYAGMLKHESGQGVLCLQAAPKGPPSRRLWALRLTATRRCSPTHAHSHAHSHASSHACSCMQHGITHAACTWGVPSQPAFMQVFHVPSTRLARGPVSDRGSCLGPGVPGVGSVLSGLCFVSPFVGPS